MCGADGGLLAIIDWGDAGWGDPALEFGQAPMAAIPYLLEGYRDVAPELLGDAPEARIVWDQIVSLLDDWVARPERRSDLARLRRCGASAGCWKQIG